MKARAVISMSLSSKRRLRIVRGALEPETKEPPTSRCKVWVEGEGARIVLKFEAGDTSALRASMNSYLRHINMLIDVLELIEDNM